MVSELHVRGYQKLRILPHQYATGHWRGVVAPATAFLRTNGARAVDNIYDIGATYSSGQGSAPFQRLRVSFRLADGRKHRPSRRRSSRRPA
jgi:hypothetical protein